METQRTRPQLLPPVTSTSPEQILYDLKTFLLTRSPTTSEMLAPGEILSYGLTHRDARSIMAIRDLVNDPPFHGTPPAVHIDWGEYHTGTLSRFEDDLIAVFYNFGSVITHVQRNAIPGHSTHVLVYCANPLYVIPMNVAVPDDWTQTGVGEAMTRSLWGYFARDTPSVPDCKVNTEEECRKFYFTNFIPNLANAAIKHNSVGGYQSIKALRRDPYLDLSLEPVYLPYQCVWHRSVRPQAGKLDSNWQPPSEPQEHDEGPGESPSAGPLSRPRAAKGKSFKRRERPQHAFDNFTLEWKKANDLKVAERQKQRQLVKEHKIEFADPNQEKPNFSTMPNAPKKNMQKCALARKEFGLRHNTMLHRVAPCMHPNNGMTLNDRLIAYNKGRYCMHGFHFNRIKPIAKPDGSVMYYVASCDHHRETVNSFQVKGKLSILNPQPKPICPRCRFKETAVMNRDCDCSVYRCTRCLHTVYQAPNKAPLVYCDCGVVHGRLDFQKVLAQQIVTKIPETKSSLYSSVAHKESTRSDFFRELRGRERQAKTAPVINMADFPALGTIVEERTVKPQSGKGDPAVFLPAPYPLRMARDESQIQAPALLTEVDLKPETRAIIQRLDEQEAREYDLRKPPPIFFKGSKDYHDYINGIDLETASVQDILVYRKAALERHDAKVAEDLKKLLRPGTIFDPIFKYFSKIKKSIADFVNGYVDLLGKKIEAKLSAKTVEFFADFLSIFDKMPDRLRQGTLCFDLGLDIIDMLFHPTNGVNYIRFLNHLAFLCSGGNILRWVYEAIAWVCSKMGADIKWTDLLPGTSLPPKPRPQSGDHSIWKKIVTLAGGNWSMFIHHFDNSLKKFNSYCSAAKNVGWLLRRFCEMLPDFLRSLFISFNSRDYIAHALADPEHVFHKAQVACLAAAISSHEKEVNAIADKVKADALISECHSFIRDKGLPVDGPISDMLRRFKTLLAFPTKQTNRAAEPFCMLISGQPGCGKSLLWPMLLAQCCPGESVAEIRKKFFVRDPSSDFWDGLTEDVFGVLYDDFGQSRAEKDFEELIKLISVAACVVDMAHLENKGMMIDPKMVVLLSNTETFTPTTLTSSGAINRRPHLRIVQHSEHPVGTVPPFDERGLPKGVTFDISWGPIAYNKKPEHRGVTMAQAMEIVYQRYQVHTKVTEDLSSGFDKFVFPKPTTTPTMTPHAGEKRFARVSMWLQEAFGNKPPTSFGTRIVKHMFWGTVGVFGWYCSKVLEMLAVITAGYIAFKVAARFLMPKEEPPKCSNCSPQSGENQTPRIAQPKVTVQSGLAASLIPACEANTRLMVWDDRVYAHVIFVRGNVFLTNRHFFLQDWENDYAQYRPKGSQFTIYSHSQRFSHVEKFDPERMVQIGTGDSDLVLYQCSRQCRHYRDITKHFANGDSILTNHPTVTLNIDPATLSLNRFYSSVVQDLTEFSYDPDNNGVTWLQHRGFTYKLNSQSGYCGAPIFDLDPHNQGRIVAIHTGHDGIDAYGLLVTRSQLEESLAKMSTSARVPVTNHVNPPTDENLAKHYVAPQCCGALKSPLFVPSKSDIVKSPLHGHISEPITIPAILNRRDKRCEEDPYQKGINKYRGCGDFPEHLVNQAVESLTEDILAAAPRRPKRILDWHQMLNGIDGEDYYEGVNMSTSAGFPYNLEGLSKRDLIELNGIIRTPGPRLLADFTLVESVFLQGNIPELPYSDLFKDERRSPEKYKTARIFSASSLLTTLIAAKYFKDFVACFYSMHNNSFSAVGINKSSLEWHKHVTYLLSNSPIGFDGDYSAWDGTVSAQLVLRLADVINAYYDDDFGLLRRTFMLSESQAMHIYENLVYDTKGGIATGSPLTVVMNTMVNELYLRIAFLALVPAPLNSIYAYRRMIKTRIYGDDNVVSVKPELIDHYNAETVGAYLATRNITYGAAEKGTEQVAYKQIKDTSFLKNKIGEQFGFYVPQMPIPNAVETINWIRKTFEPEKACEDNCNSALRELFFHGPDIFKEYRKRILKLKPAYNLIRYSDLVGEFLGYGQLMPFQNDFGGSRCAPQLKLNILELHPRADVQDIEYTQ